MRYIIIILTIICLGCTKEDQLKSVEIEISPAFNDYSKFLIKSLADTTQIEFNKFKKTEDIEEYLSGQETLIESILFKHEETPILFRKIQDFKDDGKKNEGYTDGVTVTIIKQYETKNDTNSIRVPFRDKNAIHYVYIDQLFTILEDSQLDKHQDYFEDVKSYFQYGLPITLIGESPKTYRVWGALSINEENDLRKLIQSIDDKEVVIFDFRNYKGIGTILYSNFIELNQRNNSIYYLYDKEINEDLSYIGNNKVFKSYQEIEVEAQGATDNRLR